jgi:hypothetical protein
LSQLSLLIGGPPRRHPGISSALIEQLQDFGGQLVAVKGEHDGSVIDLKGKQPALVLIGQAFEDVLEDLNFRMVRAVHILWKEINFEKTGWFHYTSDFPANPEAGSKAGTRKHAKETYRIGSFLQTGFYDIKVPAREAQSVSASCRPRGIRCPAGFDGIFDPP